jgi:hypothetical protein
VIQPNSKSETILLSSILALMFGGLLVGIQVVRFMPGASAWVQFAVGMTVGVLSAMVTGFLGSYVIALSLWFIKKRRK